MNAEILKQLERCSSDSCKLRSALAEYIDSIGLRSDGYYVAVLEYLYSNRTHPTVDEIYMALRQAMPDLSRSRIYTILDMLTRAGAIRVVHVGKSQTFYDGDTTPHGHFICSKCGRITDLNLGSELKGLRIPSGIEVHEVELLLVGECKRCCEFNVS